MEQVAKLQEMIDNAKRMVFFGGAGVSTESGIPDFRSVDGLYHQKYRYPPETMVSHSFFISHTEDFFDFYRAKMLHLSAQPNSAHRKLAELERTGKLTAVITQNIDGLHQAAGSKSVFELHGSVHRNYCMDCGRFYDAQFIAKSRGIPRCTCGGIVKPDVVLYEESLNGDTIERSVQALSKADLLIVGGTSLAVYPAAGLIRYCPGKLVVINRSPTPVDREADLLLQGNIGDLLGKIQL